MNGEKHYVRGGKPGYYPPFKVCGRGHWRPISHATRTACTLTLTAPLAAARHRRRHRDHSSTLPRLQGIFKAGLWPHPLPLSLYDPAGISKRATAEQKERGLLVEINNGDQTQTQPHAAPHDTRQAHTYVLVLLPTGRLAMLGIFGFLAESKIPGAVPAQSGLIKPYAGEYMAPFSSDAVAAIYQ